MTYKKGLHTAGIVALSLIVSGCGVASQTSKHSASSVSNSVSHGQQFQSQKSNETNWITVHTQQVGQFPTAIVGTSLTLGDHGTIIATGGYTGSVSLQSVYQAIPRVQHVGNLPQRTHDAASGYIGQALYVFGGGQAASYNTIVRIKNGVAKNVGTLPHPLSDATSVSWSSEGTHGLLLIGGYDGQTYRRQVDYFRIENKQLVSTDMFTLPVGLRYTAAVAVNGAVYLVGGQTPTSESSAIYRWDPHSGVKIVAHLPEGIQKAAVFQARGYLVVVGGMRGDGHVSPDIYAIRLSDGAVKRIGKLLSPLADMGYAQIGKNGYLVGGDTGTGYSSKVLKITLGHVTSH